VCSKQGLKSS
jgi:FAR1 DNA-binding domain